MLKFGIILLLFLAFEQSATQSLQNLDTRPKRTLDLNLLLRTFLQQSADISNAKNAAKQNRTTTTTTTTPAPTTTTPAPTTIIYKIPFGFNFNSGEHFGPRPPFPFGNPAASNGYINFDDFADPPAANTMPMPPTTTTAAPATMAPMPPAPMPTNAPQPQRNVQIIYQYVPVSQFKQAHSPVAQNHFADAPINYDYHSDHNPHGGQLDYYENPKLQYQPASGETVHFQSPITARQHKASSPRIVAAANAQQAAPHLRENLVYQYAQPDDTYTNNESDENVQAGYQSSAPTDDDTNNESDDESNADAYAGDGRNYTPGIKIRFVPVSSTPRSPIDNNQYVDDTNSPEDLNNYKYVYNKNAEVSSPTPKPSQLYKYQDVAHGSSRSHRAYVNVNVHSPSTKSSYGYTMRHP